MKILQKMMKTTTSETPSTLPSVAAFLINENKNNYDNNDNNLTTILNENLTSTAIMNLSDEYINESFYPLQLVIPFTIVYSIIFITGVIGNISTCFVIAKNRSMHTATNYYLFSLAISDMLLLISGLPAEMNRIWSPNTYIFGHALCLLQGFSAETSANATVLTITAFTIERYLAICHPFRSHKMSKLSRCLRIIKIIWVIALALAAPQAVQFGIEESFENGKRHSHCTVVTKIFEHAFEISTLVFFVAPMTLITVLYILIGRQLKKSTAKRPSLTQHNHHHHAVAVATTTGTAASAAAAAGAGAAVNYSNTNYHNSDMAKRRRHTQAQNRVVKMLIAVVAAFFICWAPFHAQRLLAVYLSQASIEAQKTYVDLYLYLMYSSGVLYYLSTCVNPFLYHIMSNKYRNAFKKTFHNLCSHSKNYTNTYAATPLRLTGKKASDNFLGETNDHLHHHNRHHRPLTADVKTFSNYSTSTKFSKLTPQTSQTSFSSSKVETSDVLLNQPRRESSNNGGRIIAEPQPSCASLKSRFLRLFKSGLVPGYASSNNSSNNSELKFDIRSNSISNSSLKDTDEIDMVCSDLVKHMKQVNDLI